MFEKQLDSEQWHKAIVGKASWEEISRKILSGDTPIWYKPIIEHTKPHGTVLEFGSGTGILSGVLAKNQRAATLIDYSPESIDFCKKVFSSAGLKADFLVADVLKTLPFEDNSFGCVWSCGLLEHFSDEDIIKILKESNRISEKYVVSLVPNAYSIPYRIGKWYEELMKIWPWGLEDPKKTLKHLFVQAGLKNIVEFSIDPKSSNSFLRSMKPRLLSKIIVKLLNLIPSSIMNYFNQGYLLVTIGEKGGTK